MQKVIIINIILATAFAISITDYVGVYSVGSQCQSTVCPRTYTLAGNFDIKCPKSGSSQGSISQITYKVYQLHLVTYNLAWFDGDFYYQFTQDNIVYDNISGQGQLQLPQKDGYTLNLMPCYNYSQTADVCSNIGPSQLAVWKTDNNGQICDGCNFSMIKTGDF